MMFRSPRWNVSALVVLLGLSGCAVGRLQEPAGQPVADPQAFELELRRTTLPAGPQQVTFGWALNEQGSRVQGRGVVRLEAPERIRLDLFGPRGETYLTAALVGDEYRLPAHAANAVALPSPSLLWAALGVLEPPRGAQLSSATLRDGMAHLRYQGAVNEVFAFTFEEAPGGDYRLTRIERAGARGVIETVNVDRAPDGTITRTRYRDWAEYRDLTLDVETMRDAAPFPGNIWRPDAIPS
jgi:hypothetical protein